jgi:hypothetical protein
MAARPPAEFDFPLSFAGPDAGPDELGDSVFTPLLFHGGRYERLGVQGA